jgi:hypothetical protein
MSGYVRIYRSLIGHAAFRTDAEAMAFAWMIAKASWRASLVRYKGHSLHLTRGELAISVRDMAAHLDRDKAWVERLWKRLRAETMIETRNETGVSVVTICNYSEYQAASDEGETARKPHRDTAVRQRRDTEQGREEGKKDNSEAKASGAVAADPVKQLFDVGVSILTDAGQSEKQARSLIGKWRKAKSDDDVLTGLLDCRARAISNPVEWLEKRFAIARYVSDSGYEYRGDVDAVIREAERRHDWGTYWGAKRDKRDRDVRPVGELAAQVVAARAVQS